MAGKDVLMVLGNTGAGKSVFLNYLMGCDMYLTTRQEAGLKGGFRGEQVVLAEPKAEGGRVPFGIGDTDNS